MKSDNVYQKYKPPQGGLSVTHAAPANWTTMVKRKPIRLYTACIGHIGLLKAIWAYPT